MTSTRPRLPTDARLQAGIQVHPVEFTGCGREYFRVWIVNVLLSIVTLGLYTPWARRRTAQYFYSHTQVAGSPLEFVAEQRRMVFGFLAFAALYLAYQLAVRTGQQTASSVLLFSFALLAPFLWASAMRFRLGATRWRGIRLSFTPSWREVYAASWPVFVIAALWLVVAVLASELAPAMPTPVAQPADPPPRLPQPNGATLALVGAAAVLTLLGVIRLEFNYRRLLVARTRIGGQAGRWKPVYADFVKVWLATTGVFLIGLLVVVTLSAGVLQAIAAWIKIVGRDSLGSLILVALVVLVLTVALLLLSSLPARAFREARMFQLVWNNIGFSHIARTRTQLRTGAYVWLRMKNVLLTLLTLGLYRPFAVTSQYAARVGSVTLYIKGGTDQLVGERVKQQGALGDAAADALGLDLIG